jgi:hypothetical protein
VWCCCAVVMSSRRLSSSFVEVGCHGCGRRCCLTGGGGMLVEWAMGWW